MFLSVESVDGIYPCHLRLKKKSTPLKVFKLGWLEILKTLPQQQASHKKGDVTHETRIKRENYRCSVSWIRIPQATVCVRLQRC